MAEMLNMVCFHVIGNDQTIAMATQAGQLELNVMMPIIAYNLLQSLAILTSSIRVFTEACVAGIEANVERCRRLAEGSIGLATALNAHRLCGGGQGGPGGAGARRLAAPGSARAWLSQRGAPRRYLDPFAMTEPGIPGGEAALEPKRPPAEDP